MNPLPEVFSDAAGERVSARCWTCALLVEVVAIAGLVGCFLLPLLAWSQLPDRVPHHFDWRGRPDTWGSKSMVWSLPAIATGVYLLLTVVARWAPRLNKGAGTSTQASPRQIRILQCLLVSLKAEVVLLFAYIEWGVLWTSTGRWTGLSPMMAPAVLVVIVSTVSAFLFAVRRAR